MKWIGSNTCYPKRYAFKKDIPRDLKCLAVRVDFPFETAWLVRDHNDRVLMPGGGWADTMDFYLTTPGHVIGLRDLTTADAYKWREEWRLAMADRIQERMALVKAQPAVATEKWMSTPECGE